MMQIRALDSAGRALLLLARVTLELALAAAMPQWPERALQRCSRLRCGAGACGASRRTQRPRSRQLRRRRSCGRRWLTRDRQDIADASARLRRAGAAGAGVLRRRPALALSRAAALEPAASARPWRSSAACAFPESREG